MLMSDLKHNFVRTYSTILSNINKHKFKTIFDEMEKEAEKLLKEELIPEESIQFVYSLDMRYLKQYHETNVVITKEEIEKKNIDSIACKFHPEHFRLYGYSLEKENTPIELINLRLLSIGKTKKPKFKQEEYKGEDPSGAFKKERKVWLPLKHIFETVPVYDGAQIRYGNRIEGPAIIEQINTTTFVTPDYSVLCDKYGSYTMYLKSKEKEISKNILT